MKNILTTALISVFLIGCEEKITETQYSLSIRNESDYELYIKVDYLNRDPYETTLRTKISNPEEDKNYGTLSSISIKQVAGDQDLIEDIDELFEDLQVFSIRARIDGSEIEMNQKFLDQIKGSTHFYLDNTFEKFNTYSKSISYSLEITNEFFEK